MWNEFSPPTDQDWLEQVARETRGKSLESLSSRSWEGIAYPPCAPPASARSVLCPHPVVENPQKVCTSEAWVQLGADGVQELAWSVAHVIEELRAWPQGQPLSLAMGLCAGPRLLLEIARFRAAHWLLWQVAEGFELSRRLPLWLRQDPRCLTLQDPHNNLLRSTLAGMVGHLASADAIELLPMDASPEAPHLAQNILHLLRYESHLENLTDPLRGSGTLEALTEQIAQQAWTEVQRIEASGGISQQSDLAQRAAQQKEALEQALDYDRQGLVGVNRYVAPQTLELVESGLRWAERFERLYLRGGGRAVAAWVVGPESAFLKARQDFVEQWLAMAGLRPDWQRCPSLTQAPSGVWILCCEDALWSELLRSVQPTVVAGKPPDYPGLCLYRGCDRRAVLEQLLEALG